MAVWTTKSLEQLSGNFVLGPERYDPRRHHLQESPKTASSAILGDLVRLNRRSVSASSSLGACLVLDTSDAKEGIVTTRKSVVAGQDIGSQKKVVDVESVIISRLRPYLRQVAYVDGDLISQDRTTILVSTEFFVLRPLDGQSIAFLVPFLLCETVQKVLSVSQEGGHHPRFNEQTLLSIPVPDAWLNQRDEISSTVERAVQLYREQQELLCALTQQAELIFESKSPLTNGNPDFVRDDSNPELSLFEDL